MDFIFRNRPNVPFGLIVALSIAGCAHPAPPPAAVADGGDAQRLVTLADYVGGDYAGAVRDGRVLDDSEYQEQLKFAADARALAKGLQADAPLLGALAEVEQLVRTKADPDRVRKACRVAREAAIARFGLETMPFERPNLVQAQVLYAESCATCHGATGNADTERARTLNPVPARFKDPRRLGELSPYRIYNTLTFGVPGTAMASFETLSPEDRWNLAFFVFRLGHEGDPVGSPVAMTLGQMALLTDHEVLEALRAERNPAPQTALAWVRREAAFTEPPAGAGIERARALVRRAVETYAAGHAVEGDRLAIDAYLQGFEPLEPRLRARDAAGTREIESAFHGLRAAMAGGESAHRVRTRGQALDRRLAGLGETGRPAVPFSVSFWMISKVESRHWMAYLREQLERGLSRRSLYVLSGLAFLAVYREAAETILFTQALLLESEAQRSQVWAGALAGLLAVVATALVMNRTVRRLPLGPFFAFSSLLLCGLAVSFAGSGIYGLVAAAGLATFMRRPETEGRIAS